jgi:hypothetical protein
MLKLDCSAISKVKCRGMSFDAAVDKCPTEDFDLSLEPTARDAG